MHQDVPDAGTLVQLVGRHLGWGRREIQFRRIPTGKFNTSYYVDGGAMPLVLRIAPPNDRSKVLFYEHQMMRQEPTLHALLRKQTDVPVPAILASDWEGYGAMREQSPEAEMRRVFYLLYEVQKYIVIRRVRNFDPQRADAYRKQSLRLAESLKRG
jgi:hypothetical protein